MRGKVNGTFGWLGEEGRKVIAEEERKERKKETTATTTKSFVPSIGGRLHEPKRITPDRAHGSTFSTHSYRAICLYQDL